MPSNFPCSLLAEVRDLSDVSRIVRAGLARRATALTDTSSCRANEFRVAELRLLDLVMCCSLSRVES